MLPAIHRILVLCEGNHCRSPLAEALLQDALGPHVDVSSAGLAALVGHPAHQETQAILREADLDIRAHRGRQFTPELALRADLILVMDRAQKEACEQLAPSARGRVFLLGHWLPPAEQEIPDPIRRGPEAHRAAHAHILRALASWVPRLRPSRRGDAMSA
ncbi:MAG TPA: low molecular weight protein-tyrosine-phosphatase [Holophaga sp.]|nr:low molecular weight protein-tyrosine-phosphatase [Holophaga sp.]